MKEVVVTGLGVITPIGNTVNDFAQALYSGKSGAATIDRFDPAQLPTRVACQVRNFEGEFRDVKITFAQLAAREAMKDAFGANFHLNGTNSILSLGIGLELFSMDDLIELHNNDHRPSEKTNELTYLNTPSDICAHLIGKEFGLNAPPLLHISACAAGTDAIGSAFLKVRNGQVNVALAGGTDSMINPMGVAGFCRIGAMTTLNDNPKEASRPFDKTRNGFVLGEGAGFVVLEEKEHALKRKAKIYAKISGYGNSLDAYSLSDPHPQGEGALKSMSRALKSAGLSAKDIDAVSVHGTGTPKNDPAESAAIKTLLGNRYKDVPVFATKSMIGHLISAAGAVETVASVVALNSGRLHQTLNLKEIDEGCDLRHIIGNPLDYQAHHIIKNSFGFGGQNATIIISHKDT